MVIVEVAVALTIGYLSDFCSWNTNKIKENITENNTQQENSTQDVLGSFFSYKFFIDNQIYFRIHERLEMGNAMMTSSYNDKLWNVFKGKTIDNIIEEVKNNSEGDCDDRSVTTYTILNNFYPNPDMWIVIGFVEEYNFNEGGYAIPNHAWLNIDGTDRDLTLDDNITHVDMARVRISPEENKLDIEYNCNNLRNGYKGNITEMDESLIFDSEYTICYDD